jgi:hypothetical protein
MKYYFREVSIKGTRKWVENGKRKQETKTFFQTMNPFNKNPDGSLKDYDQIMKEIHEERDKWLAERG